MSTLSLLNKIIRFSFYALFLFVPLIFVGDTSELFEFNKMWLTFGLAAIIGASWVSKMILEKQCNITRTILDFPILLFILSQCFSTIFSIDPHVSWWGYYSRFNGGLLSLLTYAFLYYAFVSNMKKVHVQHVITISLISGLIVSVWGLPSHFGYDPTCFIFRGNFDVSCWTSAFQPKARIFSTLGQPDWLAAYLTLLLPLALAYGIAAIQKKDVRQSIYYFFLSALFYIDFLFSRSKGSFLALAIALIVFFIIFFVFSQETKERAKILGGIIIGFAIITFFAGTTFAQFDRFTFSHVIDSLQRQNIASTKTSSSSQSQANAITGELGGTDSGKIRLFVWEGAIQTWLHNPLFGTGVETFAFAYYLYRPAGHNLTSEWDYLYNKAHNEYLNYLATTGTFGLLSYLAIIFFFLYHNGKYWLSRFKNKRKSSYLEQEGLVLLGLFAGFLTIIISNFFGFSVVILNEYFFSIPAFFYILSNQLKDPVSLPLRKDTQAQYISYVHPGQWISIIVVWILALYWILVLINFWTADKAYALGLNYDHAGMYQNAYQFLHSAVNARPDEPTFQDELAINDAVLAEALFTNKDTANADKLSQEAILVSNALVTSYPHNVTFWKSRVRVFYTLSQIDSKYLSFALEAIKQAQKLAPTDAKVHYNLGLLYAQNNQADNAVTTLRETILLKKDYRDAYYALALLLHQQAVDKNGTVMNQLKLDEAVKDMLFIYQVLSPSDKPAQEALKAWGKLPNSTVTP